MAGSDVVVVPSVLDDAHGWREGFGLVPVEAMQAGTPVVAYASGALPEVLGDAAVLVPEGDRVALARAIADVLHDTAGAAERVARGRALVAERYSRVQSIGQLAETYRMLAGCPG
jgi:glycosyltransferase involved in cell wall biosynthesis